MSTSSDRRRGQVLFLDHVARVSGAELALLRITSALSRYRPAVLLGEAGPLVDRLAAAGIRVGVLPLDARVRDFSRSRVGGLASLRQVGGVLRHALRVRALVHAQRPAIVHTNSMKAHVYGALATRGTGLPLVVHVHDRVSTDFMSAPAVVLMRALLTVAADGVVANSRATADTLPAHVHRRPFLVLPNPLDPPPGLARADLAGPELMFGIVGRIAEWKGQDVVLRAFARAFPAGSPHRLRIIGAPQFGEHTFLVHLHHLARELEVDDRVTFVGHVDDVFGELAGLQVLVHGSVIPEPFGQVVVEGMAAGLVVVAADEGGPREILRHGSSGLLYRARSVEDLAAALRRVADDPALRASLGASAVREALRYRSAAVVPALERFYDEVVARAHPPRRPGEG